MGARDAVVPQRIVSLCWIVSLCGAALIGLYICYIIHVFVYLFICNVFDRLCMWLFIYQFMYKMINVYFNVLMYIVQCIYYCLFIEV